MSDPEPKLEPEQFCELKHTIEEANQTLSSEQLLEIADEMHEEIRERGTNPKSGQSSCG